MLQTCFPYTSKDTTYINDIIAMDRRDDGIVFFTASGPVYSFQENDKFGKRLGQRYFSITNSLMCIRIHSLNTIFSRTQEQKV